MASAADAGDLAAFLARAVQLDPTALVRMRAAGGRLAAYVRLPFGVLVSRSASGEVVPADGPLADVTVGAADMVAAADRAGSAAVIPLPARRDADWRGALPPGGGWQRLDEVPVDVVRRLVRTAGDALRAAGAAGPAASAGGEALLDHPALTVSGTGRTVVLPLRVLSAAARMGFLGSSLGTPVDGGPQARAAEPGRTRSVSSATGSAAVTGGSATSGAAGSGPETSPVGGVDAGAGSAVGAGPEVPPGGDIRAPVVVVSAAGGWARLAAPFGSAYHRVAPGLGLLTR